MSRSLRPYGLQHARLPCPSSSPGVCSNSCWVSDTIQPSHPLSPPSPPAFSLLHHQSEKWKSVSCVWLFVTHGLYRPWNSLGQNTEVDQTQASGIAGGFFTSWVTREAKNTAVGSLSLLQPSIFPSIRVFSSESVLHIRWPKYWSFSFSIGPSSEYSRLISFRIDWFDLLAVQGTLKSLL